MRSSRPRYSPPWHSKRKSSSWLRNILLLIFVGLPLLFILAELIARGAVLATGSTNQLAPNKNVAIAQSYAFKLQDVNGNSYPGLPDSGRLQVKRSPLLGYELMPSQSSEYWQINAQASVKIPPSPLINPLQKFGYF